MNYMNRPAKVPISFFRFLVFFRNIQFGLLVDTYWLPKNRRKKRVPSSNITRQFNPANISTSVQRCFWVDMTSPRRTTSNQRWDNVVYVNVEIYNVEQRWKTLCFSTLNWTTLDNVETMFSFSMSIFTTLGNVETTLRIWPF